MALLYKLYFNCGRSLFPCRSAWLIRLITANPRTRSRAQLALLRKGAALLHVMKPVPVHLSLCSAALPAGTGKEALLEALPAH